jgi:hypothetical protein
MLGARRAEVAHMRIAPASLLATLSCALVCGCTDSPRSLHFTTPTVIVDGEAGATVPGVSAQGSKGPVELKDAVFTHSIEPTGVAEIIEGRVVPVKNGTAKLSARLLKTDGQPDAEVAAAVVDVVVKVVDRVRLVSTQTLRGPHRRGRRPGG